MTCREHGLQPNTWSRNDPGSPSARQVRGNRRGDVRRPRYPFGPWMPDAGGGFTVNVPRRESGGEDAGGDA